MISLSDLELHLGLSDGEDSALLIDMEKAAVAFIQNATRRYFGAEETVVEYLTGNGGRHLWLAEPPSVDAYGDRDAITVTERAYPGATETDLVEDNATNGFETRLVGFEAYLSRLGGYRWVNEYEYEVIYTRGYVLTAAGADGTPDDIAAPDDIRQLVIDLISLRYQLHGNEGLRSETIGGYSYTRFGEGDLDAIPGALDTVEAWRRPVFA